MKNIIPCQCSKEKEITEIHVKVNEIHKIMMGNGRAGLLERFNQYEGALNFVKWIAGGSGLVGLISIIMSLAR